jgi:Zn-dependent membrane protease YugP
MGGGFGLYIIFLLPGLLFSLWAQSRVKGAYSKYSQIRNDKGVTGQQAARAVLDANGLYDVPIVAIPGELTDHYDPRKRVLRLSESVYGRASIASIGVAAHEAGHAIQHSKGYAPLKARTTIVPAVQIGSKLGFLLVFVGLMIQVTGLAWFGVALFALTTIFAFITLPVEFDASKRAKAALVQVGLVDGGVRGGSESQGVSAVLDAAAWTYVAGFATSLLSLLYYITLVSGSGGGRRR